MSTITEPAVNGRASIIDLAIKASLDDNFVPTTTPDQAPEAPGSAWKAADAEKAAKVTDNAQRVATLLVDIQKAIYASRDGWRERVAEMLAKVAVLTGAAVPAKPAGPAHSVAKTPTVRVKHTEPGHKYTVSPTPTGPQIPLAPVYQWSREGFKGWHASESFEAALAAATSIRANGGIGHVRECIGTWTTIVS